ncbi:DNase I-like protein, partial [Trametes cingulata]
EGNGRRDSRAKAATKAKFVLGSLNMRGSSGVVNGESRSKWLLLNQLMRDKRIGVLALQETHLDERGAAELRSLFGQSLEVLVSADAVRPTGARGVAFVINKRVLNAKNITATVIAPGRAMLLEFEWSTNRRVKMLNVYAPNDRQENKQFWVDLLEARLTNVDVMLGDMNMVQLALDRLPERTDAEGQSESFFELIQNMSLVDGWRSDNPQTRTFSYMQESTGSQSRIDRIYVSRRHRNDFNQWGFLESGIPTDHKMVTVAVANQHAPFVGKGRWTMPTHLLSDGEMVKTMRALGADLVREIEELEERSPEKNPQVVFGRFKEKLIASARMRAKVKVPLMDKKINKLREALQAILNPVGGGNGKELTEEEVRTAALTQDRLAKLEQRRFGRTRESVAAKHWVQGETLSRYWIK